MQTRCVFWRAARLLGSLAVLPPLLAGCGDAHVALSRGAIRQPASASAELVISRVMADPTLVSDEHGEWVEIANLGADSTDLRGWQLRSAHDPGFTIDRSLVVPPGDAVILGRSADSATNGGVHVDLAYAGIVLGNSGDWLVLRDPGGVTVDSVAWGVPPKGVPLDLRGRSAPKPVPSRAAPATVSSPPPSVAAQDTVTIPPKELVVRVLDVGQGDAIFIQNGASTVLVDGGPTTASLGHHLDALGLNGTTIDAVILSHAHADHYQGLRELFTSRRRITVRYFWENQDPSANVTLQKLRDSIASRVRAGTLVYRDTDDPCANGSPVCTVRLKGGAKLHIMRPDSAGKGANNRSPAIKLVGPDSASFTMWMAGDAEVGAIEGFQRARYDSVPGMHVTALKADHHGSCNGVTDAYLDLLKPSLVVASLGAVNDYGHMHAQAKAMYQRHGIPWYRTDQNGTITIRVSSSRGSVPFITVERGTRNMNGPSDRASTSSECAH